MRALPIALLMIAGCGEWPRLNHVPNDKGLVPGTVNPGSLVEMSWTDLTEGAEDNDQPTLAMATLLVRGTGVVLRGVLDGVGWADNGSAIDLTDAACPGAMGNRSPLDAGDYMADVDFSILEPADDGTLCAAVQADVSVGWDLVPWSVDTCGIPMGTPFERNGSAVGVDDGGLEGGWSIQVASTDRIAIGFGGYDPTDLSLMLGYGLALSLVPDASNGDPGLCPSHPDVAGEAR